MISKISETEKLAIPDPYKNWKKWGTYLAERQWGTVREDYSVHGDAWGFIDHEKARSNAYRWGEEGIAGFCDSREILCLAPAFWNGKDTIIKERLFGLTNNQGNHGEDVKELYFHMVSSPTHSYCKYLYKYPHKKFPYDDLLKNNNRSREESEYELLDTDSFRNNAYFDCYIEYAKADIDDILMKITIINRGLKKKEIHVLPHLWFRNFWKHNKKYIRPNMKSIDVNCVETGSVRNGRYFFYHQEGEQLFCENETNNMKIYNVPNTIEYVKDGINDHVVNGKSTVNPEKFGSKMAVWNKLKLKAGEEKCIKVRLSKKRLQDPWTEFDVIFNQRIADCEEFYDEIIKKDLPKNHQTIAKRAFSGLLWTKQFYYYDVFKWLFGGPGEEAPFRFQPRNFSWQHLTNRHVISMPDKWEYPWYAAWDLAFHMVSFVDIDPFFAKEQLILVLQEYYMHPNGQIPAYEWNFSDVNPPVHSWAVWNVYEKDKKRNGGVGDFEFLEKVFQKLLINFTWWVNQKDKSGTDLFEGGFLGLDNIGVFDRNHMPPGITRMQQADATSWMALFALNMLRISLELSITNKFYEEAAAKFFRHFLNIAWAMHHIGKKDISLWDDDDNFYYDVVEMSTGATNRLRVRSLVGIIPLFAVEIMQKDLFKELKEFNYRAAEIVRTRPDLASLISNIQETNIEGNYLFSIMRGFRLGHLLKRLLDEDEFLSDYGIRSLSKYHEKNPFVFEYNGRHEIHYEPGESRSDMFGGNSNWRGPIWMPLNYLIIQSLRKYYTFYGPEYQYEFPTGSGNKLNLQEIANELTKRLIKLFERNSQGKFQYHSDDPLNLFSKDEHFKDLHLFYEFFDGDTGKGLGASHQTGWTALIANLIMEMENIET